MCAAARRAAASVTVDGVLDEAVWQQAARLTDFSQYAPVDGRAAEDATDVLVFYSPTTIYFGIKAHAAAGAVHATLANRDRIDADDSIQIFLNPFNDGRQALVFGVNPLGVQADGALVEGTQQPRRRRCSAASRAGAKSPTSRPDYVFQSKGRLTDDGYEIEIAIPFKTLRFPSDKRAALGASTSSGACRAAGHEDSWTPALRAKQLVPRAVRHARRPDRSAPRARPRPQPGRRPRRPTARAADDGWTLRHQPARSSAATCAGA